MKPINELFEDSFIYRNLNINDEKLTNNINSSICLIFDGVYDIDFFSNQIQQLIYSKITVVQILKGLVLVNFNTHIQYLGPNFFKRIKLLNYDVSSIFLKKSHLKQLYDEIYDFKKDLFYVYFEDNYNIFNIHENQIQNVQHVKKTTSYPHKCFYGFNNLADLISFYIHVIESTKIWPIFAILPQQKDIHKYNFIKEEKNIIRKNKALVNKFSHPHFNPIKDLFYISFIEKDPPKPQRQMNVSFSYGIKCISDLQISYCYQNESIRTFLGFDNKFRCFHVFEYIKNNNTNFIDIKIVNEIDKSIMNNIHLNLYYLETLNLTFDCSVLFSLNYKYAFNFNNYGNDLSNFYCFDDYNDFVFAKECFKKSLSDKCDYIFKNLKMIDEKQYSILFPNESKKNNFSFIIFRMKNINESNKDKKPKLDIFLKEFSSFRSDVECTIDGKKYIVVGFENIEQRNKAFSLFKDSKYYSAIKSYNPEYLFYQTSDTNYIDKYIEKDALIQSFIKSIPETKLTKINNDNQNSLDETEVDQNLKQSSDVDANLNDNENKNENDAIMNESKQIINDKTAENQTQNELKEYNNNETKNDQNLDYFSVKTDDYTNTSENLIESMSKVENNDKNQQTKVSSNNECKDKIINKNSITKNKHLISLSTYKKEKKPLSLGTFSKVYIVNRIKSQKKFVAKIFTIKPTDQQPLYKDFFNDIEFYCCFNNPALLKIYGYNNRDFENKKFPTILLDYMPNGSFQNLVKTLNDTEKYITLLVIAYGMKYLHSQGVIHRNLKPDNILFDSNFCPKICDFGLSIIPDSELLSDQKSKTFIYTAPEVLFKNASYSFKSDVYSFAFITYKLLTDKEPFQYIKSNDQLFDAIKNGIRPDLSIISDSLICHLLRKCWSDDPNERPAFDEIYNEILSPQFRLAFKAKDKDIFNYLDTFDIEIPFPQMNEEIIQKESDKGDVELMTLYGQMLYFGINCQKNINKSIYYEIKAANEGNIEAMYFLSHILDDDNSKKSQDDSIKFLKEASDKGHDKAIIEYGKRLLIGKGCQVDYKQAANYLSKSLEFNDAEAMFFYGMMLKRGKGVRLNKRKASQYFQISADLGNKNSMFEYAKMLHFGNGANIDIPKAEFYYKNAIKENNYDAYFCLGIMHIDGSFHFNPKESEKCIIQYASLENNELVFEYFQDKFEKMVFNDSSERDYYNFAQNLINMAEYDSHNNNEGAFPNGLFSVDSMKGAVSSIFQMAGGIFKSVFSGFNINEYKNDYYDNNESSINNSDDFINFSLITSLYNQINENIQKEKSKSIEEVEIISYPLIKDDDEISFYLSNLSVPKEFRKCVTKGVKKIGGKVTKKVYRFNDPTSLCTFYTFSSPAKIFEFSFILLENSMQFKLNFMPIDECCLCFEENLIPQKILPEFITYLRKLSLIHKIHQNIFDGKKISTYLLISEDYKMKANNLIRSFLLQKNVIFDSTKYPLQNTIIIKEQFILKNRIDFEIIVNEIKSIKSINIINIERNKLYLYYNNHFNNMFQKSSFICFKNKTQKMIALNHINKILFKGHENILIYDLNLHYATIDETFYKKEARELIPTIFQKSRGFRELQQNVFSIESPVPRTYVGFNSMENLINCYSKFYLKLNIMISRGNIDISSIDDLPYQNEHNNFEEEYLFYSNL